MRMANEVDLLARDAGSDLLIGLLVHDPFDHCWNIVPSDHCCFIVEVHSSVKIVIDRIILTMRDRVSSAPDVAQPDVIATIMKHRRQEWQGNVSASMVKPSVRIFREAVEEEHDALGPLVRDSSSPASSRALDAEHCAFVIVLRRIVIGLPVVIIAPVFESLLDLRIVYLISLAGSCISHNAPALLV